MRFRKNASIIYSRLRRRLLRIPQTGAVSFGDLRRVTPVSRDFGTDRGRAVDRHYIEDFLQQHAADVRGRVLEIGEDLYTRRYGGNLVSRSDVLHVHEGNPNATIVADLADAPQIPDNTFDSIILTQTLHLIYDARAAVRTIHRILRPGGVLLLTVPGLTPVPNRTQWGHTWFWSFTSLSVQRMLAETFGSESISIGTTGNVLVATAFLHGLAAEELERSELDVTDPDYPVIITARARKASAQA